MDINNKALSIEELEERFETTVAALDGDRCSGNVITPDVLPDPDSGA